MSTSASGPGLLRGITRHQYASDNILQSYDVLRPERPLHSGHWVVYIHGGYFRDPKVDSTSLKPAISLIEESNAQSPIAPTLRDRISGYASINYRLSPHPAYPQEPSTTPSYTLNSARWPDQPNDIMAALRHLQRTYPDSKDYVLVGHSVGATLAFLAALRCGDADLAPPQAIVGVSGIYDFPAIHKSNPDYEALTNNGMDRKYYGEASPALYTSEYYEEHWATSAIKRTVLLAHSKDDGLVNWQQPEEMLNVLQGKDGFDAELIELKGEHNQIWEKGTELVRAIAKVLDMVA